MTNQCELKFNSASLLEFLIFPFEDGSPDTPKGGFQQPIGSALFTVIFSQSTSSSTNDADYCCRDVYKWVNHEITQHGVAALMTKSDIQVLRKYVGLCVDESSFLSKEFFEMFLYSSFIENNSSPHKKIEYLDQNSGQRIELTLANSFGLTKTFEIKPRLQKISEMMQNNEVYSVESYSIQNLMDICISTLSYITEKNMLIKKCAHCGRYFVPSGRSDTMYCDYPSPEMPSKSCRSYVPYRKWQDKERADRSRVLYKQIYNTLNNKAKRWKGRDNVKFALFYDAQNNFANKALKWIESAKNGKTRQEDYIDWLLKVKKSGGLELFDSKEGLMNGEHQIG